MPTDAASTAASDEGGVAALRPLPGKLALPTIPPLPSALLIEQRQAFLGGEHEPQPQLRGTQGALSPLPAACHASAGEPNPPAALANRRNRRPTPAALRSLWDPLASSASLSPSRSKSPSAVLRPSMAQGLLCLPLPKDHSWPGFFGGDSGAPGRSWAGSPRAGSSSRRGQAGGESSEPSPRSALPTSAVKSSATDSPSAGSSDSGDTKSRSAGSWGGAGDAASGLRNSEGRSTPNSGGSHAVNSATTGTATSQAPAMRYLGHPIRASASAAHLEAAGSLASMRPLPAPEAGATENTGSSLDTPVQLPRSNSLIKEAGSAGAMRSRVLPSAFSSGNLEAPEQRRGASASARQAALEPPAKEGAQNCSTVEPKPTPCAQATEPCAHSEAWQGAAFKPGGPRGGLLASAGEEGQQGSVVEGATGKGRAPPGDEFCRGCSVPEAQASCQDEFPGGKGAELKKDRLERDGGRLDMLKGGSSKEGKEGPVKKEQGHSTKGLVSSGRLQQRAGAKPGPLAQPSMSVRKANSRFLPSSSVPRSNTAKPWLFSMALPVLRPSNPLDVLDSVMNSKGKANFSDHYELGKVLGRGSYGSVVRCMHLKTGREFACKVVRKDRLVRPKDMLLARMEFHVHKRLSEHDNIIQVEDLYEDNQCLYLVMELCAGGDLFDSLTKASWGLEEEKAAGIFAQLLSALRFCHENNVLHRDIKLENVLLSRSQTTKGPSQCADSGALVLQTPVVKLSDFGSALLLPDGEKAGGRTGGSKMYQAPEVQNRHKYDFKADMWSLGVVLYALLSSSFPFTAPTETLLTGMIKRGVFHMTGPRWDRVSPQAKDVVRQLLQMSPEKRPSAECLSSHPWVLSHAWSSKGSMARSRSIHLQTK